jgi:hypothetical protein
MADEILWSNIVGEKTLENGGYVGDLLEVGSIKLTQLRDNGQLTDEQMGTASAAMITQAITSGIQFELEKKITEAKLEAEQKQSQIIEQNIIKAKAETALVNRQARKVESDIAIADAQKDEMDYKLASILPQELNKMRIEERRMKAENSKFLVEITSIQNKMADAKAAMVMDYKLKQEQMKLTKKKLDTEAKQIKILERQHEGFANNMYKEQLKLILEATGMIAQAGDSSSLQTFIGDLKTYRTQALANMIRWTDHSPV